MMLSLDSLRLGSFVDGSSTSRILSLLLAVASTATSEKARANASQ